MRHADSSGTSASFVGLFYGPCQANAIVDPLPKVKLTPLVFGSVRWPLGFQGRRAMQPEPGLALLPEPIALALDHHGKNANVRLRWIRALRVDPIASGLYLFPKHRRGLRRRAGPSDTVLRMSGDLDRSVNI